MNWGNAAIGKINSVHGLDVIWGTTYLAIKVALERPVHDPAGGAQAPHSRRAGGVEVVQPTTRNGEELSAFLAAHATAVRSGPRRAGSPPPTDRCRPPPWTSC
jgi:hypothetical protein